MLHSIPPNKLYKRRYQNTLGSYISVLHDHGISQKHHTIPFQSSHYTIAETHDPPNAPPTSPLPPYPTPQKETKQTHTHDTPPTPHPQPLELRPIRADILEPLLQHAERTARFLLLFFFLLLLLRNQQATDILHADIFVADVGIAVAPVFSSLSLYLYLFSQNVSTKKKKKTRGLEMGGSAGMCVCVGWRCAPPQKPSSLPPVSGAAGLV